MREKKAPGYMLGGIPNNAHGRRVIRDIRKYANRGRYELSVRNNGPRKGRRGPGYVPKEDATEFRVYFYPGEAARAEELARYDRERAAFEVRAARRVADEQARTMAARTATDYWQDKATEYATTIEHTSQRLHESEQLARDWQTVAESRSEWVDDLRGKLAKSAARRVAFAWSAVAAGVVAVSAVVGLAIVIGGL